MSSGHSRKGSMPTLTRGSTVFDIDLHNEIEHYEKRLQAIYDSLLYPRVVRTDFTDKEINKLYEDIAKCEAERDEFAKASFQLAVYTQTQQQQYRFLEPLPDLSPNIGELAKPIGLTSGNEIIRYGWLEMSRGTKFSKRFIVITPGKLSWFYKEPDNYLEYIEEQFILLERDYTCRPELFSDDNQYAFCIENSIGEKLIEFNSATFEERRQWVDSIVRSFRNIEYQYKADVTVFENLSSQIENSSSLSEYLSVLYSIPEKLKIPLYWVHYFKTDHVNNNDDYYNSYESIYEDLKHDTIEINGNRFGSDIPGKNIADIIISRFICTLIDNCTGVIDTIDMIIFAKKILYRTLRTQFSEDILIAISKLTSKTQYTFLSVNLSSNSPLCYTITSTKQSEDGEMSEQKGPYVRMTTEMTYRIANQNNPSEYWVEMHATFVFTAEYIENKEDGYIEIITTPLNNITST